MGKLIIGKPASIRTELSSVPPKAKIEDVVEDVEDVQQESKKGTVRVSDNTFQLVDIKKPDRKTVQGPDLNVRVPGSNPNNEPVIPFGMRGFYCGG